MEPTGSWEARRMRSLLYTCGYTASSLNPVAVVVTSFAGQPTDRQTSRERTLKPASIATYSPIVTNSSIIT
jgi:hypothetical protein